METDPPLIGVFLMYATIDIGTNSVLLLIAHWKKGELVVDRDVAHISRLGEGLHQSHLFSPEAQKRTLAILRQYHLICQKLGVKKIIVAGMSAFRRATNGADFLKEIGKGFGWKPSLLSGDEEARLAYLSVAHDFGEKYQHLFAVDIGGGSTEIIWKDGTISLNLGSVILTETYFQHCPPWEGELIALGNEINEVTEPLTLPKLKGALLVGLAGTVTTLSAIRQKLKEWSPAKIQGSILKMGEIEQMIALFSKSSLRKLKAMPGMVPGREDTLLAGALILKKVMELLQVHLVVVSDRGVRYGLFYETFPA